MKKIFAITMLVFLIVTLLCSCSPDTKAKETVKGLFFNFRSDNSRGVIVSTAWANLENWETTSFDWYFTAELTGGDNYDSIRSLNLIKIEENFVYTGHGFYVGDTWTFTVYGVNKGVALTSTTSTDILLESNPVELTFTKSGNVVRAIVYASENLKTGTGSIRLKLTYNPETDAFIGKYATVVLTIGNEVTTLTDAVFAEDGTLTISEKVIENVSCCDGEPVSIVIRVEDKTIIDKVVRNSIYVYKGITTVLDVDLLEVQSVGGTIFYDAGDNGATYRFFDKNLMEITDDILGNESVCYYAVVSGIPEKDRFYAVYPKQVTDSFCWSYFGIMTSATDNYIGSGKINTAKVLAVEDTTDTKDVSLWKYIETMRTEKFNDCDDWFIGSEPEYDELRETGCSPTSFDTNYVMTSVLSGFDESNVHTWNYYSKNWFTIGKLSSDNKIIPLRAF